MKFFASLALFVTLAVAAPRLEPVEQARELVANAARENCYIPSTPDNNVIDRAYKVGKQRGLNAKLMLALFETLAVETNFHNPSCGDQDSIGCLQQRPSMKVWGTYNEIMNIEHAVNAYLNALEPCEKKAPWKTAGQLAQCAQVSDLPWRYDQEENKARTELNKVIQRLGGGGGSGGAVNVGGNPNNGGSNNGGSSNNNGGSTTTSGPCGATIKAKSGNTCSSIAKAHGLSAQQFIDLNKGSINKACTNLQVNKSYCIQKGKTTTPPKSTPSKNNGTGTSKGASSGGCKTHATAKKGDNCGKMAAKGGISVNTFLSLNKNVNKSCTNLQVNTSYCIA